MILSTYQDAAGSRQSPRPTLAHVPGVTVTSARPETDPTQPTIRTATRSRNPTGIALQAASHARRVEWVKLALHEIAEGGL
jgi:hypothetical protein